MWGADTGRINDAKGYIDVLHGKVHAVDSELYRVGTKAMKLERAEIDKMLVQIVIEPARTEWSVPIITAFRERWLNLCLRVLLESQWCEDKRPYPMQRMEEFTAHEVKPP